jgi:hypothetical protein
MTRAAVCCSSHEDPTVQLAAFRLLADLLYGGNVDVQKDMHDFLTNSLDEAFIDNCRAVLTEALEGVDAFLGQLAHAQEERDAAVTGRAGTVRGGTDRAAQKSARTALKDKDKDAEKGPDAFLLNNLTFEVLRVMEYVITPRLFMVYVAIVNTVPRLASIIHSVMLLS